jgi:16S rRNA (cytosine1402-N4)-methyltransferase
MARIAPETYHVPVLLDTCLQFLNVSQHGTYLDATLGGGGHTAAILGKGAKRLFSFDADEVAIAHCQQRFANEPRLTIIAANFEAILDNLPPNTQLDGALYDLGVSSYQFDHHHRGFSFRQQAPLDMRFTPTGETAADILNTRTLDALSNVFWRNADEPQNRRIAEAIVTRRTIAPFSTVGDMRQIIQQTIPPQHQAKTLARVFQALRIEVNNELQRLSHSLQQTCSLLAHGARIVVISYHSLEDRIVKEMFKSNPMLRVLTKKPIEASTQELQQNPRSRSALLRCAERLPNTNFAHE